MSSGSEVALILKAQQQLAEQGVPRRVVSMARMKLFPRQPEQYQQSVLPVGVRRVAIEAADTMSWYEWAGSNGEVLGLSRFGASAPYEKIYAELRLTVERITGVALRLSTGS
jgi:transketolase